WNTQSETEGGAPHIVVWSREAFTCSHTSSQPLKAQPCVARQPLDKAFIEEAGGSPEATGTPNLAAVVGMVQGEADGCLPEHLAGGAVSGVTITGDLDPQGLAVIGSAEEAHVVAARQLRFRARAFTRFWQQEALHQPAHGFDDDAHHERAQADHHGQGGQAALDAGAR